MSRKTRCAVCYAALVILTLLLGIAGICFGSVSISAQDIAVAVFGGEKSTASDIILISRLPRVIAAVVLGGALAVSGYLLQTFFANPIAGPFVLGISSGAKLVVALTMIVFLGNGVMLDSAGLIIAAFVGSLLSLGLIIPVSGRAQKNYMLIVCGIMIGYICSAITEFVVTFADDSNIVNLHNWSMGSFSGIGMDQAAVMSAVVFAAMIPTFLLSKQIGAYQLGEAYARNSGVNIRWFRLAVILLSSLLSACVTAFAGPVSFVGIAVPHIVKRMLGTAKPRAVTPASFLGGACFCLLCDLIARTVFAPTELSIGSVTAVLGAPVVIVIMMSRKK